MAESAVSDNYSPVVNNQATSSGYMHIPQNGCLEQANVFSQPSVNFLNSLLIMVNDFFSQFHQMDMDVNVVILIIHHHMETTVSIVMGQDLIEFLVMNVIAATADQLIR